MANKLRAEIDVTPLREMALKKHAQGMAWVQMERRAWPNNKTGHGSRFARAVGAKSYTSHGKKRPLVKSVSYEQALRLCQGMQIDPVDMGL